MSTIKQKDEFLKQIAEATNEINENIQAIKHELVRLQAELDSSDKQYTLEGAKRNKELTTDIQILKETLANAKERKDEIIQEHSQKVFSEAKSILDKHKAEMNAKHEADKAEIVRMIKEIRKINHELQAKDMEYTLDERDFVDAVVPYVATKQSDKGKRQAELLKREAWNIQGNQYGSVLNHVKETDYRVQGLLNEY